MRLKNSTNKAKTLLDIQTQILQDEDRETVVVHKSANNPTFNQKRRSALKTIAATTLLTTASNPLIELLNATFGKTLLQPSVAKAYDVEYPPGIATCRDKAIKEAYGLLKDHNNYGVDRMKIFEGIMKISDSMYLPNSFPYIVKPDTPYIEPAYWFLCAMEDDYKYKINQKLKKKNQSLYYFSRGMIDYFQKFVYNKNRVFNIEKHLLNSIFAAAYGEKEMEAKTKQYLNSNFQEKTRIIKETAKIFQNMHIDPSKNEINDNYDKALTAQWASYWLVTYYVNLDRDYKIIYDLEQDGFMNMNSGKIDLRVRGPPHYEGI